MRYKVWIYRKLTPDSRGDDGALIKGETEVIEKLEINGGVQVCSYVRMKCKGNIKCFIRPIFPT